MDIVEICEWDIHTCKGMEEYVLSTKSPSPTPSEVLERQESLPSSPQDQSLAQLVEDQPHPHDSSSQQSRKTIQVRPYQPRHIRPFRATLQSLTTQSSTFHVQYKPSPHQYEEEGGKEVAGSKGRYRDNREVSSEVLQAEFERRIGLRNYRVMRAKLKPCRKHGHADWAIKRDDRFE